MYNFLILALFSFAQSQSADPINSKNVSKIQFETDIRPILKAYCLDCHGGTIKPKGGLDLRLKRFAVKGGASGTALVEGNPGQSPLWERMNQGDMPPGEKKVPSEKIALVERWIREGAVTKKPEPEQLPPGLGITEEDRSWWAFVPLKRSEVPFGKYQNPIDAFIGKKLAENGLDFNAPAGSRELLVRAAMVLTGIPPTLEEIQAFEKDKSPDRWTKAVDRLLGSPAYGERWARHWLDVVGYSDSEGDGSADSPRDHAWRYRDWVIRAFNRDLPLDKFILEQLAGDELVPKPWSNLTADHAETLAATGFLRMVPGAFSGEGAEQVMTDTIKVLSASLLGVSVGCAQCHDHRYDPISQEDYFRIRAILEPAINPAQWRGPGQRLVSLYTDKDRAKAREVDDQIVRDMQKAAERESVLVREAFEKELQKYQEPERTRLREAFIAPGEKRTAEQKDLVTRHPNLVISGGVLYQYNQAGADEVKGLRDKAQAKGAAKPPEGFVMVMDETGAVPQTKLFYRGDPRQPQNEVFPGDLAVLSPDLKPFPIGVKPASPTTSGRRLAYARHLTSGSHPLFGRVMANRIWMHHFGAGLVDTPGEFGRLGQIPSHPELLNWLALELPARQWSLKSIHRLILNSRTWQQSGKHSENGDKLDAGDRLLHRYPTRRLEAEVLRDRILVAAGRLDRTAFGPAVPVVEDISGQVLVPDDKPRRSIYLQQKRSKPVALMGAFDQPVNMVLCEKRVVATNAPQALMLLNGNFVHAQAKHLASRIITELEKEKLDIKNPESILDRTVVLAWQKVLLRDPIPEEKALSVDLIRSQTLPGPVVVNPVPSGSTKVSESAKKDMAGLPATGPAAPVNSHLPDKAAVAHLAHQLLISNEFLHVP